MSKVPSAKGTCPIILAGFSFSRSDTFLLASNDAFEPVEDICGSIPHAIRLEFASLHLAFEDWLDPEMMGRCVRRGHRSRRGLRPGRKRSKPLVPVCSFVWPLPAKISAPFIPPYVQLFPNRTNLFVIFCQRRAPAECNLLILLKSRAGMSLARPKSNGVSLYLLRD